MAGFGGSRWRAAAVDTMFGRRLAQGVLPMSVGVACRWIAAVVAVGLTVSGAVGQESAGGTGGAPTATSHPLATRPGAIVPPVRRVRPKTPSGPVAKPAANDAAAHKRSATVRRGARIAAPACAQGAAFNRKFRRCERKNGAKTRRGQERGAPLPMPRAAPRTR
jgi:hypothetical protein